MTIYIPWGGSPVWHELKYALRSFEENIHTRFEVVIYGTFPKPEWLQNVTYVQTERFYPEGLESHYAGEKDFENWFDTLNKLRLFVHSEYCSEKFVYAFDDVLLLKTVESIYDIPNVPLNEIKNPKKKDTTKHEKTILEAVRLASENYHKFDGLRGKLGWYNYDTHMPRRYERERWKKLFEIFPIEKQIIPYSSSTLYFNIYQPAFKSTTDEVNPWKASFMGELGRPDLFASESIDDIKSAVTDKMWMNYSNNGLTQELIGYIGNRFSKKSRFEC